MWNKKTKIAAGGAVVVLVVFAIYGLFSRKNTSWPAKAGEEAIKVSENIKARVSMAQRPSLELVGNKQHDGNGKPILRKDAGGMEVALDRSDKPLPKGADSKSKVKGPPDISLDEKGNPLIDDKGNPLPVKK